FFRVLNALIGFGGILVGLGLVVWFASNWLRHGRDPDYLDDPSIYMPAPPPELTPAAAALLLAGLTDRRALTTAMLDLASHGELRFEEQPALPLMHHAVTILLEHRDDAADPQLALVRRHPLGVAEGTALVLLSSVERSDHTLEKEDLAKFAQKVSEFNDDLEAGAVKAGWFVRPPKATMLRWRILAGIELAGAVGLFVIGMNLPSDGLVAAGLAVGVAGVVTLIGARWMPAVTREGAMVRAM